MNKQAVFILVVIIIVCVLFCLIYVFQKEDKQEEIIKNDMIFDENTNEVIEDNTIETISQETKTTPNTVLTLKKYYTKCGHTINDKSIIPEEMVNLSKEEIENSYTDWEIEEFSAEEIILTKTLDEFCGEHYYLTEEDNYINIYSVDENGNKVLQEENRLSCEYLPETDRIALRNGIMIYTKEELNKILEDFES